MRGLWRFLPDSAHRKSDIAGTRVTVIKGDQPDGTVTYEFPALAKLDDLRTWYRANFEVTEIPPPPHRIPHRRMSQSL